MKIKVCNYEYKTKMYVKNCQIMKNSEKKTYNLCYKEIFKTQISL